MTIQISVKSDKVPVYRAVAVLAATMFVTGALPAQTGTSGFPHDWSHHHLIFSNPGTVADSLAQGRFTEWYKIVNDPRYLIQQKLRGSAGPPLATRGATDTSSTPGFRKKRTLKKDWGEGIGSSGIIQPNAFPAKYQFSTTTDSCSDFAVFPTGLAGSSTAASIVAFDNLYIAPSGGCSTSAPSVDWAYNTGGGTVSTSPLLSLDGTQVAFIRVSSGVASLVVLKWNAGAAGSSFTGSVTNGSTTVSGPSGTFSSAQVGLQISGTDIPSGDTIVSITSPTQAVMASAATGTDSSDAITIHAEAVGTPGVPVSATNSTYRNCTAPCYTTVALNGGTNDTWSAPFYDYQSDDALYVGDNGGKLHKFVGVFSGSPAECTSSYTTSPCPSTTAWPLALGSVALASPVYDNVSGCVFVGGTTSGILYSVQSGLAGGTVCTNSTGGSSTIAGTSSGLATGTAGGIYDAPIVDSTAGKVYAFVGTTAAQTSGCTTSGDNCVYQFPTNFTNGVGLSVDVGKGLAGYYLFDGAFDNVYYESANGTAGNLYTAAATDNFGSLYQIPIGSGGAMGTPNTFVSQLGNAGSPYQVNPSPVSEFCNNGTNACAVTTGGTCGTGKTCTTSGTDYIFFSIYHANGESGCTNSGGNACILGYNVTNPASVTFTDGLIVAGIAGDWATTGFIIDNALASGGSQIYFITLDDMPCSTAGSGLCATQAAQSGP